MSTALEGVQGRHEISLDGTKYLIRGAVSRQLVNTYPGKIVIGDTSRDSRPYTSVLAMTDFTGGIGIERLVGESDVDRTWFTTLDCRYKGHLVLPPRADSVPTPTGVTADLLAWAELAGELYGVFGTKIYKYDGASWSSSLHTLRGVFNYITQISLKGEDYLVVAHEEGIAYSNDGTSWTDTGVAELNS